MNSALVQCPKCRGFLLEDVFNRQELIPCPSCKTPLEIEIFPAFFRRINPGKNAETVMVEGESSCFFHPEKKAIIPCASCGRFLCALCDCELHGQHLCPTCLETGRTKGKIKNLENQRMPFEGIALTLAVIPAFFTALAALFIVIRFWNSPRSIVRRTKFRYVAAAVLALLQIVGWIALFLLVART